MALITGYPLFRAFNDDGSPLAGGLLNTYVAGTTTPKTTYADAAETTPNANPVVLDSRGEARVYLLQDEAYKFVLTDADGAAVATVDNVGASLLTSTFGVEHNIATGVHEFPGTSAAGDTFYQDASSVVRLALGPAGYILTAGASAPVWAERVKFSVVDSTRDVSSTGNQSLTGVGFKPQLIFLIGHIPSTTILSMGYATSTINGNMHDYSVGDTGANRWRQEYSKCLTAFVSTGNHANAELASMDSDGFTLTWSKAGSPTGTINFRVLCIGW